MREPRIVIFGINYSPEPTGIATNTTWLAESLVSLGWQVTVVTGVPHYPHWRRLPLPPQPSNGLVSLVRRPHYVPASQSALRRGAYELSWFASALPATRAARGADLALGIVPSLSGGALAAAAARRYGMPCALLFQDLLGRAAEQAGVGGARSLAGPVRAVETALASRAAGVAVVAEGFRDYFEAGGVDPARLWRVRNPTRLEPPSEGREATRARLGWRPDELVVLHSGSMGYKQGLENVVQAAHLARSDGSVRFVLQGGGNQTERLRALAGSLDLANVTFLPLAAPELFSSTLCAADALLLNQRASVRNMSLPGKLGDYFAAGRPVIAAVAADDETAREVEAAGGGVVAPPDDPAALLQSIALLRADPGRASELGAAGREYAERVLDPKAALETLVSFLEAILSRDHPSPTARRAA